MPHHPQAFHHELDRHISQLQINLLEDTTSSIPIVTTISQYYFKKASGKKLRPRLVLLVAMSTIPYTAKGDISDLISPHRDLAEVVEMIHVASLLHDDVLDESPIRRGSPSAPVTFGNKKTVLGDVVSTLVEGELRQASDSVRYTVTEWDADFWVSYLEKTYMKTASLFADSLRASVLLWGPDVPDQWIEAASSYGKQLGMAFQIADDILDYLPVEPGCTSKPYGVDLKLGLITAPLFFAVQENPSIMDDIIAAVRETNALKRSRELVKAYVDQAKSALSVLPDSDAKSCLLMIAEKLVHHDT
ncbi:hypothetical protein D9758_001774 [Tetrapyrgos nigripes]|uniref:(2E,6E)-farnesyl diphosphate synthase n=1 Tax=Tetrapyrgos nigripes TaxID=182062 RepID=A0A8H5LXN2_9AGAR|nr:hypothetical protein D9758_001774 [Tetrapyrgos nigripes]